MGDESLLWAKLRREWTEACNDFLMKAMYVRAPVKATARSEPTSPSTNRSRASSHGSENTQGWAQKYQYECEDRQVRSYASLEDDLWAQICVMVKHLDKIVSDIDELQQAMLEAM